LAELVSECLFAQLIFFGVSSSMPNINYFNIIGFMPLFGKSYLEMQVKIQNEEYEL